MYSKGNIGVQFNKIEKILSEVNLLSERNYYPTILENNLSDLRRLDYVGVWKYYYSKSAFNFHLPDNSIFSFKFDLEKPSFCYLGCPFDCVTYKDFLIENDCTYEEVGESFYDNYENYLDGCSIKIFPTYIRYDYDANSYNEGSHPISHFHIGYTNQIRIGIMNIIDPFTFVCFILRQNYPDKWSILISHPKFENEIKNYKEKIPQINLSYFNKKDKYELYLK